MQPIAASPSISIFNRCNFLRNKSYLPDPSVSRMLSLVLIALLLPPATLLAQTWPPPGTLSSSLASTNSYSEDGCTVTNYYYSWAFTDPDGGVHSFPGNSWEETWSGPYPCTYIGPYTGWLQEWSSDGFYYLNEYQITETATFAVPQYKVASILYATPGTNSSDSYTNTTTAGSTTSIGSSLKEGTSVTFGFNWTGGGVGITFGTELTTGNNNAFTETFADASSLGNASNSQGLNTISHSQDLFAIWLNPLVTLYTTAANTNTYAVNTTPSSETCIGGSSAAAPVDLVYVTAAAMLGTDGATTIPIGALQRQYDGCTQQYDLPGLASICANQSQYVNNCSEGGQCGCVPGDFTAILSKDPILNLTTADDPSSVDTSGSSACWTPTSSDSCRYVMVPTTSGGSTQVVETLSGPETQGGSRPTNQFTQTDSTQTVKTLSESTSETVGVTIHGGVAIGPTFSSTETWTWTDTESTGAINGTSNSLGFILSSSTVSCYEDVAVFEDTIFHTFVTQQENNGTCP